MMSETTSMISATEAAVYDRQMRLWGVEAQKRLQKSHVFISGLNAMGAELVKNLVLSGMNVTIHDVDTVTATCISRQFFFSIHDIGKNRAEIALPRAQELNPLVRVDCVTKPLDKLADAFLEKFNVICVINASKNSILRLDNLCRARKIAFYSAHGFGFDGIILADLGEHSYRKNIPSEIPQEPVTISFPTLEETFAVQWNMLKSSRKRGPQIPNAYIKHQLLIQYESSKGEKPAVNKLEEFVSFSQMMLKKNNLPADYLSLEEMSQLVRVANVDIPPVSAILAGILGQEVIKAISQKDEPICNCVYFDGRTGLGAQRKIVQPN